MDLTNLVISDSTKKLHHYNNKLPLYFLTKIHNGKKYYAISKTFDYDIYFLLDHINDSLYLFKFQRFLRNGTNINFGLFHHDIDTIQGQLFLEYVNRLKQIDASWNIDKWYIYWRCVEREILINGFEKIEREYYPNYEINCRYGVGIVNNNNILAVKEHKMEVSNLVPYILYCNINKEYYNINEINYITDDIGVDAEDLEQNIGVVDNIVRESVPSELLEPIETTNNRNIDFRLILNNNKEPFYLKNNIIKSIENYIKENNEIEVHLLKEVNYEIKDIGIIEPKNMKTYIGELDEQYKKLYY